MRTFSSGPARPTAIEMVLIILLPARYLQTRAPTGLSVGLGTGRRAESLLEVGPAGAPPARTLFYADPGVYAVLTFLNAQGLVLTTLCMFAVLPIYCAFEWAQSLQTRH